jgi:CrcB protein
MIVWAGVALLGGLGAVGRVLVAERFAYPPVGILAVNVSGALALGILAGSGLSDDALRVWGGGLLGGYTTFSTWMVQTRALTPRWAFANVAVSLALGLAAVAAGRALA